MPSARVEVLEHQLAVLLGQLPQAASYDPGAELPVLPPLPDTGLPSDLLSEGRTFAATIWQLWPPIVTWHRRSAHNTLASA